MQHETKFKFMLFHEENAIHVERPIILLLEQLQEQNLTDPKQNNEMKEKPAYVLSIRS